MNNDSSKLVSFCTPVLNRLSDLRGTLSTNLKANEAFSDKIEFLVLIFDQDDYACRWISSEFAAQIKSGYLRVIHSPALKRWHFGKAKNAFRELDIAPVYVSLDGDNFQTYDETRTILDAYNMFSENFCFHLFSGDWGDGSCGKIALGRASYLKVGYDEQFYYRQFDDLDLILSSLAQEPELVFISFEGIKSVLERPILRSFWERYRFENEAVRICAPLQIPPLNQKQEGYTAKSKELFLMNQANRNMSFAKNSPSKIAKMQYFLKVEYYSFRLALLQLKSMIGNNK